MALSIPSVTVDPPTVENGDVDGMIVSLFEFIGRHPVPFVIGTVAVVVSIIIRKPFVKGILVGAAILVLLYFMFWS